MDTVKSNFSPEFLNRIDEIIIFNRLNRKNIDLIVGIQSFLYHQFHYNLINNIHWTETHFNNVNRQRHNIVFVCHSKDLDCRQRLWPYLWYHSLHLSFLHHIYYHLLIYLCVRCTSIEESVAEVVAQSPRFVNVIRWSQQWVHCIGGCSTRSTPCF